MSERICGLERHLNDANFCSKACFYCTGDQMDRCEYNKPKEEKEPVKAACSNCKWHRKHPEYQHNCYCCRFPEWLIVSYNHYCGEWKGKDDD